VPAARGRLLDAGEHAQQRGLAGAVASDEADTIAALRFGADVLEDVDGAERDGDRFECDDGYGRCSSGVLRDHSSITAVSRYLPGRLGGPARRRPGVAKPRGLLMEQPADGRLDFAGMAAEGVGIQLAPWIRSRFDGGLRPAGQASCGRASLL
jgi:hypothetical protein